MLLTDTGRCPGQNTDTGLIELLHLNANQQSGAVISFPANLVVDVPGHGDMRLGETLTLGGPSLLIETVERLTGVRIEHYSRMVYFRAASGRGLHGRRVRERPLSHDKFRVLLPPGRNTHMRRVRRWRTCVSRRSAGNPHGTAGEPVPGHPAQDRQRALFRRDRLARAGRGRARGRVDSDLSNSSLSTSR